MKKIAYFFTALVIFFLASIFFNKSADALCGLSNGGYCSTNAYNSTPIVPCCDSTSACIPLQNQPPRTPGGVIVGSCGPSSKTPGPGGTTSLNSGGTGGGSAIIPTFFSLYQTLPGAKGSLYKVVINVLVPLLIIFAIILCLFFLIWGGFDWMTSGGDKQKLHSARQKISLAIIGLVVVFLSFFIMNIILNFLSRGYLGPPCPTSTLRVVLPC